MKNLSQLLTYAVVVLFFAGTFIALEQMIGHPSRYIEQPQRLGDS